MFFVEGSHGLEAVDGVVDADAADIGDRGIGCEGARWEDGDGPTLVSISDACLVSAVWTVEIREREGEEVPDAGIGIFQRC